MLKYNIKYIVTYCSAAGICVIFLTAQEGGREGERGRDVRCRRCDSKKVKVHAENIYPHRRSPEVSLLEVCVPLDTLLGYSPTAVF
jgi:hypothetical protein